MNAKANTTVSRFEAAADTVVDNSTRLMWSHTLGSGDYEQAEKLIAEANEKKLGGFDDWRMPERNELILLTDLSRKLPAIDTAFFPDTKSDWYWTSSPSAFDSDGSWFVGFDDGNSLTFYRGYAAFVRAVRSARQ